MTVRHTLACPYFRKAFGWCVPIGGLGGLIGLGGGEFRLPVLMHALRFDARLAIPLNLMVSLATLAFALAARSPTLSPFAVASHLPEILGLIAGGIATALYGAGLVRALSGRRLIQVIAGLLAALGLLLLVEAFLPAAAPRWLPADPAVHFVAGAILGLGIGLVSSLLGVAGGELIIPALIFVFGADIRVAGTASILISLCLVPAGLWRHWRLGAVPQGGGVWRLTLAMSLGSILGAGLGGLAVAVAPVAALKLLLGTVLIAAAAKTLTGPR